MTEYAETKSKNIKQDYIGLHYRPFSNDNTGQTQQQIDLDNNREYINTILESHKDKIVFVSTPKNILKDYLRKSVYTNYYINDFVFPDDHEQMYRLNLNDDELFTYFKETLCDMYCLSKCKKIYRIANWFSGFLFFSCTFNQTSVPNLERFIPEMQVIPL